MMHLPGLFLLGCIGFGITVSVHGGAVKNRLLHDQSKLQNADLQDALETLQQPHSDVETVHLQEHQTPHPNRPDIIQDINHEAVAPIDDEETALEDAADNFSDNGVENVENVQNAGGENVPTSGPAFGTSPRVFSAGRTVVRPAENTRSDVPKNTDTGDTGDAVPVAGEGVIDVPDVDNGSGKADVRCVFAQTMAWRECESKVACPTTCAGPEEDCTFPYCNMNRQCECRKAFCRNARMCYFFRIDCKGKFTCQNSQCVCG